MKIRVYYLLHYTGGGEWGATDPVAITLANDCPIVLIEGPRNKYRAARLEEASTPLSKEKLLEYLFEIEIVESEESLVTSKEDLTWNGKEVDEILRKFSAELDLPFLIYETELPLEKEFSRRTQTELCFFSYSVWSDGPKPILTPNPVALSTDMFLSQREEQGNDNEEAPLYSVESCVVSRSIFFAALLPLMKEKRSSRKVVS